MPNQTSFQKVLKDHVFSDYLVDMSYSVVGTFTQYLILTYGIDKYLKLYRMTEQMLNKCFKDVYDCSIKTIQNEF